MTSSLPSPPSDCISRVLFAPGSSQLLVSSWDAQVRLYDARTSQLASVHKHSLAVLDCSFLGDATRAVSVGLERKVVLWDFIRQQESLLGRHDEGIRCVEFHQPSGQVFTGSWDRSVRAWDPRQPEVPTSVVSLEHKIFAMDVGVDKIIVGASDKRIHIFDSRMLARPLERRDSLLKHQIRALKIGKDPRFYASSSVEGRVGIEYFDATENEEHRYAFKCHRVKNETGGEVIHPVNSLAFHPVHGTFATGGSDGGVCVWDAYAKKRLWRLNPFSTAVSSLSFSDDGAMLAIGVSYTFDHGDMSPMPANEIIIRQITDSEVLPKAAKR